MEKDGFLGRMESESGEELSLKGIKISGALESLLFSWNLSQEYVNETKDNLEIIYTFPLGYQSVLLGMSALIGDKKLDGVVVEKAEAEEKYEDAVSSGDSAIMVQQSAFGLYTANLGNIAPGEKVIVNLHCAQMQKFDGDRIRIALPLFTGERYGDAHAKGGLAAHESVRTSGKAAYSFDVDLDIKGEMAKGHIECPGWNVVISETGEGKKLKLAAPDLANRDFVLVISDLQSRSTAVCSPDRDQFMLVASFAPEMPSPELAPVNLNILVDCSGSMMGTRIDQARKGLSEILKLLKPQDTASLNRFGSEVKHETGKPVHCDQAFMQKLSAHIDNLNADMGGTELEKALISTFNNSLEGKPNEIFLITDGDVWNIDNIVRTAKNSGHRIYAIGVGSAPGESLLRQMAEKTGGACEFANADEDMGDTITRLFKKIRSAYVSDITVDWDTEPIWASPLPKNIYDGETAHLFALFSVMPTHAPLLKWKAATGPGSARAENLTIAENSNIVRMGRKIQIDNGEDKESRLKLALDYQLVTDLTSLVLVLEREEGEKLKGLPKTRHVPQMRAKDNFMHKAYDCFANSGMAMCFNMIDTDILDKIKKMNKSRPDPDQPITNRAAINEMVCELWLMNLSENSRPEDLLKMIMEEKKLVELQTYLDSVRGALSLEEAYALFIFWALNEVHAVRYSTRPLRPIVKKIGKDEFERLNVEFDHWLNGYKNP